jgi:hypothetical protein
MAVLMTPTEALKRQILLLSKMPTLEVGVLGEKAAADHRDSDGATVADVAHWNHYGTRTIPARPFMSIGIDRNRAVIEAAIAKATTAVVERGADPRKALGLIGQLTVGLIQQEMSSSLPPPNAPATVAAKGSSVTLIHAGQLRSSVSWRIVEGE